MIPMISCLGETASMIRDTVMQFAEREIAPIAAQIDETNNFPQPLWQKMGALGLLGITVAETDLHPLSFVAHAYPDFHLLMLLYTCTAWTGEPAGDEGQPIAWHMADALNRLAMPPADLPLLMPLQAFVAGR